MLEIKAVEIRGKCPVHKVGNKIVIDDPRILLDRAGIVFKLRGDGDKRLLGVEPQ